MNYKLSFVLLSSLLNFHAGYATTDSPQPPAQDKEFTQQIIPKRASGPSREDHEYKNNPVRVSVRHIEKGGIGYNQGYTSLDIFLSYPKGDILPFLDLRGHVFNNGKLALNSGVGLRYLHSTRIYGAQIYYDYRQASILKQANQIGLSLESLGKTWDFRLNGYFPFGKTSKTAGFLGGSGTFSGNYLILNGSGIKQSTMIGCNAEVGSHLGKINHVRFYGALSPYYFKGNAKNAYGGKVRVYGAYKDFIKLELSDSYDSVFHNNFQGQLTLSIPIGPKTKTNHSKSQTSSYSTALRGLMNQPVVREEIIVENKHGSTSYAIDPFTGLPIKFIFVDNTSHSLGTFESPYPTLTEAIANSGPSDILYIYPGDGTSAGLSSGGYTLQDRQQVLGAGISHTIMTTSGPIEIPAMAKSAPQLSNALDLNASILNLANQNTIAGLHFAINGSGGTLDNPNYAVGLRSGSIHDVTISSNEFAITAGGIGVFVANNGTSSLAASVGGTVTIANNTFSSPDLAASGGVLLFSKDTPLSGSFQNNTISGIQGLKPNMDDNGPSSLLWEVLGSSSGNSIAVYGNTITQTGVGLQFVSSNQTDRTLFDVQNNTINEAQFGIVVLSQDDSSATPSVRNNVIDNIMNNGVNLNSFGTSKQTATISENSTSNCLLTGISVVAADSSISTFTITQNTSNNNVFGIRARSLLRGNGTFSITNNEASGSGTHGISTAVQNGSTGTFTINHNVITGNTVNGMTSTVVSSGTGHYTISSNVFTGNGALGCSFQTQNSGRAFIDFSDNTLNGNPTAVAFSSGNASHLCVTNFSSNAANNPSAMGYTFSQTGTSTFNCVNRIDNTPATFVESGSVTNQSTCP